MRDFSPSGVFRGKFSVAFLIWGALFNLLCAGEGSAMSQSEIVALVLKETSPLESPRGDRLPLYVWPLTGVGTREEKEGARILKELDKRGIAVISIWSPGRKEESLKGTLWIGKLQKKLGLKVNVNATSLMYAFFKGDERTAHITDKGEKFFDYSFSKGRPMGCPFTLEYRIPEMKERMEFFVKTYKEAGIPIDFIFADWEIDGPIEWNGAWEASKKCKRCRENIPRINDFTEFQKALRIIRSRLQKEVFADTVKKYFPHALVGNYGVYPHNGYRYWYDYFEKFVQGAPYKLEGGVKYRQWFQEFPLTGYTFAMPVVYTWYPIFNWYDFPDLDYRWFYNMLLVASNAGESTPMEIPIISFVHWTTTALPPHPDPEVKQFSQENYKELLWHMLLRGVDGFFLWCRESQLAQEIRPLHEVYAESLKYKEFLDKGEPISFGVPPYPGPVISGLRLEDRVLVRRTDFEEVRKAITLKVKGKTLKIPPLTGKCQILKLR